MALVVPKLTPQAVQAQYEGYALRMPERAALFSAVAGAFAVERALYPGSYIDISPSFCIPAVTYVDNDRKARAFFADLDAVRRAIVAHQGHVFVPAVAFYGADYTKALPLPCGHFDLLISFFAGFVSASCTRYLRPGGWLLANDSHGDASLAALDPSYRLVATIEQRGTRLVVVTDDLQHYFVPKRDVIVTADALRRTGRGIAYTRSPSAYLFQWRG